MRSDPKGFSEVSAPLTAEAQALGARALRRIGLIHFEARSDIWVSDFKIRDPWRANEVAKTGSKQEKPYKPPARRSLQVTATSCVRCAGDSTSTRQFAPVSSLSAVRESSLV